jgi:hypothetical protein
MSLSLKTTQTKNYPRFLISGMSAIIMACVLVASLSGTAFALTKTDKASEAKPSLAGLSEQTLLLVNTLTSDAETGNYRRPVTQNYRVNVKGPWGIKFDIKQNLDRPSSWSEVDAGAYYRITPTVRVGGSLGFGPKTGIIRSVGATKQEITKPRVQLETSFKF